MAYPVIAETTVTTKKGLSAPVRVGIYQERSYPHLDRNNQWRGDEYTIFKGFNGPPTGLKENYKICFLDMTQEVKSYENSRRDRTGYEKNPPAFIYRGREFKELNASISFERKNYGTLRWSLGYNEGEISKSERKFLDDQLKEFILTTIMENKEKLKNDAINALKNKVKDVIKTAKKQIKQASVEAEKALKALTTQR